VVLSSATSTVVLIDPLDTVCPRLDQTSSDSDRQAVTSLTNLFDRINKVGGHFVSSAILTLMN